MRKKLKVNQIALDLKSPISLAALSLNRIVFFFHRGLICWLLSIAAFSVIATSVELANAQTEIQIEKQTEKLMAVNTTSYPLIRDHRNPELQAQLQSVITEMKLGTFVKLKRLGIALVDITDEYNPRFAGVNGDSMMYAASLPKIAILFGLFKSVEQGALVLDPKTLKLAEDMIRTSSNSAATALINLVGFEYLANLLQSDEYRLYEQKRGGGLWVGKVYGKGDAWRRDPMNQLSHGATPIKVARFYYLLETNRLVNPELTAQMKSILVDPGIHHKFVKGLDEICPEATLYRKSGTWRNWHSDSAIISHGGKTYIAVVLLQHDKGSQWLPQLIQRFDQLIFAGQAHSGCYAERQ